jgi:pimeloyl-ACP methyl ester carboxylesterase
LLHGWALDGALWTPQLEALTRHHRVVVVDRRGFGRSTGQASIEREARDLRVFCLRLGLRKLAILGMSQATRVALRLAQCRSLQVTGLVLDGPPEPPRDVADPATEDPPLSQYRQLLARSGLNAFRRAWGQHPLLRLHTGGGGARWLLNRMSLRYRGRDLLQGPGPAPRARKVLPDRIKQPVLVVCGDRDLPYRLDAAQALAAQLPKGSLALLPGAGHLPNLDQPRHYNRVLAAFLRGPQARRSRKS